jgi:hypothetical protein
MTICRKGAKDAKEHLSRTGRVELRAARLPSFPRRRESRSDICNGWIPAFAGMTVLLFFASFASLRQVFSIYKEETA